MEKPIKKAVEKVQSPKLTHLPSKLNIDENDLPELKDWQVGEVYTFTVKAKLMSLRKDDPMLLAQGDEDADKFHADFNIEEVRTDRQQEIHEASESKEIERKEHEKNILKKAVSSYRK